MSTLKVLYVEDEDFWVDDVRDFFPDLGLSHAKTRTEALDLAAAEDFELALVDMGLFGDEEAGLEIVRELRGLHPELNIAVVTARTDLLTVKRSIQYGAMDYVDKADLRGGLEKVLSRVLKQSRGSGLTRIETLTLVNFKSWRDQREVAIGRLTLFLGPNSAGKSAAIQALLLLKQTVDSADRALPLQIGGPQARHIDLGTFDDVVFGHNRDTTLTLGLSWSEVARQEPIYLETTVGLRNSRLHVLRFEYRQGNDRYGMELTESTYLAFVESASESRSEVSQRSPIKSYGFPTTVLSRLDPRSVERMQEMQLSFERLMHRVHYLQPLRTRPARIYTWGGDRPEDVGVRGDRAIDALLALERDNEEFEVFGEEACGAVATLNHLLTRLGLASSLRLEQISARQYDVRIIPQAAEVEVGLADLGFGLSQVLPILVLGLYAPAGSIVLVEQPELHLHPAAQVGLGDIFIELAQMRGIQFIVETHSEHLLRRIQRRVAEQSIDAGDFRLYFCRRDQDGTIAEELHLDEYGKIDNWPPGFFGDPTDEGAKRLRAEIQRRQQEAEQQ